MESPDWLDSVAAEIGDLHLENDRLKAEVRLLRTEFQQFCEGTAPQAPVKERETNYPAARLNRVRYHRAQQRAEHAQAKAERLKAANDPWAGYAQQRADCIRQQAKCLRQWEDLQQVNSKTADSQKQSFPTDN